MKRESRLKDRGGELELATVRRGTAAALLDAVERCSCIVEPGDVEELERLIAEGCERPAEVEKDFWRTPE